MFLGWQDADKKYPVWQKLTDAVERYQEKFGDAPTTCLTSVTDAEELGADARVAKLKITILGVAYVPRHTFYVGTEDALVQEQPVSIPLAA